MDNFFLSHSHQVPKIFCAYEQKIICIIECFTYLFIYLFIASLLYKFSLLRIQSWANNLSTIQEQNNIVK